MRTELCDYSETCQRDYSDPLNTAACVSCGADARKRASRRIDGVLVEDCQGCQCYGWRVSACFSDPKAYGEPFIVLDFQRNYDVRRFAVTQSGRVADDSDIKGTVTVTNPRIQVRPDGLVELDITVDEEVTDNYQVKHRWQMAAHVVATCPK